MKLQGPYEALLRGDGHCGWDGGSNVGLADARQVTITTC